MVKHERCNASRLICWAISLTSTMGFACQGLAGLGPVTDARAGGASTGGGAMDASSGAKAAHGGRAGDGGQDGLGGLGAGSHGIELGGSTSGGRPPMQPAAGGGGLPSPGQTEPCTLDTSRLDECLLE